MAYYGFLRIITHYSVFSGCSSLHIINVFHHLSYQKGDLSSTFVTHIGISLNKMAIFRWIKKNTRPRRSSVATNWKWRITIWTCQAVLQEPERSIDSMCLIRTTRERGNEGLLLDANMTLQRKFVQRMKNTKEPFESMLATQNPFLSFIVFLP